MSNRLHERSHTRLVLKSRFSQWVFFSCFDVLVRAYIVSGHFKENRETNRETYIETLFRDTDINYDELTAALSNQTFWEKKSVAHDYFGRGQRMYGI